MATYRQSSPFMYTTWPLSLPSALTSNDITGDLDLFLSRHEHQDVPHGGLEVYLNHLSHSTLHIVFTWVATEHEIHWEGAARDLGGRKEGGRGKRKGGKEGGDEGGEGKRRR